MRTSAPQQLPLVPQIVGHQHVEELREMSRILDATPQAAELVLTDLLAGGIDPAKGRGGLSGDQVLRVELIEQVNNFSYEEFAFHLPDSMSDRSFFQLGMGAGVQTASALQNNVKKVGPDTM